MRRKFIKFWKGPGLATLGFSLALICDAVYTPGNLLSRELPKEISMNRRVWILLVVLGASTIFTVRGAFSKAGNQEKRRAINLPGPASQLPFSKAILTGDTLYISGSIGLDPKTGKAPDKIEDELRNLFDDYKATLSAAGMNMDDLVYVQVSCTDLSLYEKFNAAYRAQFAKDFPAREFIGAASLLRGGHFEMQAIAVRR